MPDPVNQGLRAQALFFGPQHDWRAVGVIGADIDHCMALHALKPDPDVSLDVFDQVPKVNGAVGVGQGRGDQNLALSIGVGSRVARTRMLGHCAGNRGRYEGVCGSSN